MSRRKPGSRNRPAPSNEPRNDKKSPPARNSPAIKKSRLPLLLFCVVCFVAATAIILLTHHRAESTGTHQPPVEVAESDIPYSPRPARSITFNHDIAPIVFTRCAPCHHTGQPAPFELLTYREVAKRARQIAEVTQTNYMPPWLPEHGYGKFLNERRLTAEEKGLIQQWASEGTPEGSTALPPAPQFPDGWILGRPDLVVTMTNEYVLGAEGADVYRNFVIPVPDGVNHYVRALEFSPGNSRIVHHAFVKVDSRRASRLLDAQDGEPGFPGMNVSAEMPIGQFLSWQPGKQPSIAPEGLTWLLPKNSDLIAQLHLNRSGKVERIRPRIGLYFTNIPPSKSCARITLTSLALDIPAGESNYVVTDELTLPVDVEVLSILPHAHYLAREIQSYAALPDGTKKWLLNIKRWNFRWQGDYQYAPPVFLPKGATVHLQFTYDNSTNNPSNPNPTPKRVRYGPQSTDEMCELWFQISPASASAATTLQNALNDHLQGVFRRGAEHRLEISPNDADAHTQLAILLFGAGKSAEAITHLTRAEQLNPNLDQPHFQMGMILRSQGRLSESKTELETALRLNPKNSKAYGHLGFLFADQGDAVNAERCFVKCLQLDPNDELITQALAQLRQIRSNRQQH